ncbi:PspC domain-containing protein [Salipaludibacillus sp. HK11]|uniref:PspC domain-containing protein n=1 Tax=Salipaludibacillus sp. HK11 TaxID=3394320 RepID=UPI0039FC06AF
MGNKKLIKSSRDKALFGVCGGIAEFFGISTFTVRLIFIVTPGFLVMYLILAASLDEGPSSLY